MKKVNFTYRKCRNGWHLYDGKGFEGICSRCVLKLKHPTLGRLNELLSNTRLERGGRSLSDMQSTIGEMPVRRRTRGVSPERLYADYKQAISLLKEDLIWSGDFDNIRFDLMELIQYHVDMRVYPAALTDLVQRLISDENDLSI